MRGGIDVAHRGGMGSTMHGGPNVGSGLMYSNTHIDDNFQLKTNVDQTQFGFLPSILKSFQ